MLPQISLPLLWLCWIPWATCSWKQPRLCTPGGSFILALCVQRRCQSPCLQPAPLQVCGPHPHLLLRSAQLCNCTAHPSQPPLSSLFLASQTSPPHTSSAHFLSACTHTPPARLISHSLTYYDPTYSICSRTLPEPPSSPLFQKLYPQEKKDGRQPALNTEDSLSAPWNLDRIHHTSV